MVPFTGEMSNLAIHQSAQIGPPTMLPPGLEADYSVIRQLPLFEGIPNDDLIHAMSQRGIALRPRERYMSVLDPIGLSGGQPAPWLHVASGPVSAAVFTEGD